MIIYGHCRHLCINAVKGLRITMTSIDGRGASECSNHKRDYYHNNDIQVIFHEIIALYLIGKGSKLSNNYKKQ